VLTGEDAGQERAELPMLSTEELESLLAGIVHAAQPLQRMHILRGDLTAGLPDQVRIGDIQLPVRASAATK
jgi:hypothetical protein